MNNIKTADEVSAALERAQYEMSTERRLARVGLKQRQELAPIIERYSDLYRPEQIEAVNAERGAAQGERQEELRRLYFALLDGYVDARAAPIYDEVVTSFATATATVDGTSYPFHALAPTISSTDDAALRERLLDGMVQVVTTLNPLLSRQQEVIETALREIGFDRYIDFVAAAKRVDYAAFAATISRTLEATQSLYRRYVGAWIQAELGRPLDGTSSAHTYWLRRNQVPDTLFPAEKMQPALRRSLLDMGIDLDRQTQIHIDAEDRPTKNPRACVFGARVPGEVHLIIKPTGGKGDYEAFFHEAGHAEHFACTDPSLPFAFRALQSSMAQLELFSYLMQNLVNDPLWLQTYLDLSPEQAALVSYRAALNDLFMLRRYCAKYLYEYEFFTQPAVNAPELYAADLRRQVGFVYPAAFWQYDRDPAFYSADYLRAWFGHAQVLAALQERFGSRWWADAEAGAYVRGLWQQGVRPDIEDVVQQVGAKPWDVEALLGYYEQRITRAGG